MTYTSGHLLTAYLALLIPVAVSAVLWFGVWLRRASYQRRFQGWRRAWEMWISTLLITTVLCGAFAWYLFWRPFYTVTIDATDTWTLGYVLPTRMVQFTPDSIDDLRIEPERLPIRRAGRARQSVIIELRTGQHYTSAPSSLAEANALLANLRATIER